jgi:predicted transcriptional regulator
MAGTFEEEVKVALEIFLATIRRAAERAAVEVIRSSFARVSVQMGGAVGASDEDAAPPDELAHRRASSTSDLAAMRERVVSWLRANPGSSTVQLGRSLGIHSYKLRRYLRKLADDGVIRFEESSAGLGGLRRRAYYVVEVANEAPAEGSAAPVEATA